LPDASGLDAIVEVERLLRASASHVHAQASKGRDVDAIEKCLIVRGDGADGSSIEQRAQKSFGYDPAIRPVGAAENLVNEEEYRAILLCGADGLLQALDLCEKL